MKYDGVGGDEIGIVIAKLVGSEPISIHRVAVVQEEAGGCGIQAYLYLLAVAGDVRAPMMASRASPVLLRGGAYPPS